MDIDRIKKTLKWNKDKLKALEKHKHAYKKYDIDKARKDIQENIDELEKVVYKYKLINNDKHISLRKALENEFPHEITKGLVVEQLKEMNNISQNKKLSDVEKDLLYSLIVNY
jgi:hypothetical protein